MKFDMSGNKEMKPSKSQVVDQIRKYVLISKKILLTEKYVYRYNNLYIIWKVGR